MPELTIDEALSWALRLHQRAFAARDSIDFGRARAAYERIIAAVPQHAGALHYLGVLMHQTGDGDRAVELISEAMKAQPGDPAMYNNLGNVLTEQGRHTEAVVAYRTAIELGYTGADAESNLGVALKQAGQPDEACAAFRRAIALDPRHAASHNNLGGLLASASRYEEAVAHFEQAVAANPELIPARQGLAVTLLKLGSNRAISALRDWLEVTPDDPTATHYLAAFSQQDIPSRASDGYVRDAFDALANSFDAHLHGLGYRAPELVAAALAAVLGAAPAQLDVLDAGCGTGLCVAGLKPYARRLVGVDLSPGMLKKAAAAGGYDELVEAELTAFIASHVAAYDVIASADTLCYFGDLGPVLLGVRGALRAGGVFAFTVERFAAGSRPFLLHAHGRYSHSEDYVREAIAGAALTLRSLDLVELRTERGEPVIGLVVVAGR